MILVCGATGMLGSRIVERLRAADQQVRALVRPSTDASALEALDVDVVRGDLRDAASLRTAVTGVDTVVSTANAISRILAGDKDLRIPAVDGRGNRDLIRAAETAGVRRFVFLSAAGIGDGLERMSPYTRAKAETERLLTASSMEAVLVRPPMFMEVWLAPVSGIDPAKRRATIYGRGRTPHRYVAVDDVAALCVQLATATEVPRVVELGGPEAMTRDEAAAAFGAAAGRRLSTMHVPRPVLAAGSRALWKVKPEIASLMGMALFYDRHPSTVDDTVLREAGIEPRAASDYIRESATVR